MSTNPYDVIIIGAGPGGYVAAIRASQLGLRTAIVEREHLGGICLNWGCIPTKALLRSAEVFRLAKHAQDFGVSIDGNVKVDAAAVVRRSRAVSGQLNGGVGYLLKKNKVDVIWGEARIQSAPAPDGSSAGTITVSKAAKAAFEPQSPVPKDVLGEADYAAKAIVIATGARPRVLPGLEPDGERVWTYFEAMVPKTTPKSLIILGAGAIGIEFASFYRELGANVTVVEALEQILPAEDEEIAAFARKALEGDGIHILTGARIDTLEKRDDGLVAKVQTVSGKEDRIEGDILISAAGVVGNIEGLGLEDIGVETDCGTIKTDGAGKTNIAGIFAIGDVAGPPMLAHKAEHEGVICVEAIAGRTPHLLKRDHIPACTYCHPQVASVGLTEASARNAGHNIKVGRFSYRGNGKAIALGDPEGLVKTIFDESTGQLLGAHLVGAEVTELIQGFVIAMQLETTEEDLMRTIFPHPTLSEMMHESVLDAYDRVMHM